MNNTGSNNVISFERFNNYEHLDEPKKLPISVLVQSKQVTLLDQNIFSTLPIFTFNSPFLEIVFILHKSVSE